MQDGSEYGKKVYDRKPYTIFDEKDYHSVWEDYKQIASFKTRELAFEYVEFLVRYSLV